MISGIRKDGVQSTKGTPILIYFQKSSGSWLSRTIKFKIKTNRKWGINYQKIQYSHTRFQIGPLFIFQVFF